MDVPSRLLDCKSRPEQKEKVEAFQRTLEEILACAQQGPEQVQHLQLYIQAVLDEQVGLVVSRQLLNEYISLFDSRIAHLDVQQQLLELVIEQAKQRSVSFEEQLSRLREKLANVYEIKGDYAAAASTLKDIQLDSGHRPVSDDYKLQVYIRIVRLLLENDQAVDTAAYLNRAALLVPNSNDPALCLSFKLSQARILDAKRRFLEAYTKYHELSSDIQLDEDERLKCLSAAVQCAVLAGAGPQRSRSLATLYKDERTHHLPCFSILEKTYLDRIIRPQQVSEFASTLKPHHLARLRGDGSTTVFDRAMIEHNVLSASKIYNNISFDQLGGLLGISAEQAEQVAAHMIGEKRMVGSLDQVDKILSFESGGAALDEGPKEGLEATHGMPLRVEQSMRDIIKWDAAIHTLCHDLDVVINAIQTANPNYAPETRF